MKKEETDVDKYIETVSKVKEVERTERCPSVGLRKNPVHQTGEMISLRS